MCQAASRHHPHDSSFWWPHANGTPAQVCLRHARHERTSPCTGWPLIIQLLGYLDGHKPCAPGMADDSAGCAVAHASPFSDIKRAAACTCDAVHRMHRTPAAQWCPTVYCCPAVPRSGTSREAVRKHPPFQPPLSPQQRIWLAAETAQPPQQTQPTSQTPNHPTADAEGGAAAGTEQQEGSDSGAVVVRGGGPGSSGSSGFTGTGSITPGSYEGAFTTVPQDPASQPAKRPPNWHELKVKRKRMCNCTCWSSGSVNYLLGGTGLRSRPKWQVHEVPWEPAGELCASLLAWDCLTALARDQVARGGDGRGGGEVWGRAGGSGLPWVSLCVPGERGLWLLLSWSWSRGAGRGEGGWTG